jgi:hypothetical protein
MGVMENFLRSFYFHMLIAAAIAIACQLLGFPNVALVFNLLFWPVREAWQHRSNLPRFWSLHVVREWLCPAVVGIIAFLLPNLI